MLFVFRRDPKTGRYSPIEPYRTHLLKVSSIHTVYVEESGNPRGKPALFLHGGPGGGTDAKHREFFDPEKFRIVLVDQRGCGKSTPLSCLDENTTWDLVSDLELIRKKLEITNWLIFGGSWGSTLAMAYAEKFPEAVSELVLRGIFLLRKKEIDWFYQEGASFIFPDAWEKYVEVIPKEERADFVEAYHKRLTSENAEIRSQAAKAWSVWEAQTSRLFPDPESIRKMGEERFADVFARIECHYFINRGFFRTDGELLTNVGRIRSIPSVIVQGRYDVCCPMDSAWALHRAWPEAEFVLVPDAGHSVFEPGITKALIDATDKFLQQ